MNNESVSESQFSMHQGFLIFVNFWTNCNVQVLKALFWGAGISALNVIGKSMRVAGGALGAVYHMTSLTSATQWASKPKPNLAINYTNMRRHNLCRMLIPAPAHNKLVGGHQKPSDH